MRLHYGGRTLGRSTSSAKVVASTAKQISDSAASAAAHRIWVRGFRSTAVTSDRAPSNHRVSGCQRMSAIGSLRSFGARPARASGAGRPERHGSETGGGTRASIPRHEGAPYAVVCGSGLRRGARAVWDAGGGRRGGVMCDHSRGIVRKTVFAYGDGLTAASVLGRSDLVLVAAVPRVAEVAAE